MCIRDRDYGYSTNMLKGCTRLLWINRGGDDVDENLKPNMNNEACLLYTSRCV